MSERLHKLGVAGCIGLAAGIAMAGVDPTYGGRHPRSALLIAVIATIAIVVALKMALRRSWGETAIVAALAFVVIFVVEVVILRRSDSYSMAYMQTDLILLRLAIPSIMLLGGSWVFRSLRSLKAWVGVICATAVANVLSSSLFGAWGDSGYFPFGATLVLPTAALFAAFAYMLADEPA